MAIKLTNPKVFIGDKGVTFVPCTMDYFNSEWRKTDKDAVWEQNTIYWNEVHPNMNSTLHDLRCYLHELSLKSSTSELNDILKSVAEQLFGRLIMNGAIEIKDENGSRWLADFSSLTTVKVYKDSGAGWEYYNDVDAMLNQEIWLRSLQKIAEDSKQKK
jgi:hypothetical protein